MSAASSTSPMASTRFLPASRMRIAASRNFRSRINSAARRMMATRSCHGRCDQSGKAALGGGHRVVDVGFRTGGEAAEDDLVVDWRADLECLAAAALLPGDHEGVGLPQLAAQIFESGIEGGMHRFDLLGR